MERWESLGIGRDRTGWDFIRKESCLHFVYSHLIWGLIIHIYTCYSPRLCECFAVVKTGFTQSLSRKAMNGASRWPTRRCSIKPSTVILMSRADWKGMWPERCNAMAHSARSNCALARSEIVRGERVLSTGRSHLACLFPLQGQRSSTAGWWIKGA